MHEAASIVLLADAAANAGDGLALIVVVMLLLALLAWAVSKMK